MAATKVYLPSCTRLVVVVYSKGPVLGNQKHNSPTTACHRKQAVQGLIRDDMSKVNFIILDIFEIFIIALVAPVSILTS